MEKELASKIFILADYKSKEREDDWYIRQRGER